MEDVLEAVELETWEIDLQELEEGKVEALGGGVQGRGWERGRK